MSKLLETKTRAPSTQARMTEHTVVLGNPMPHYPQPCTARKSSGGTSFGKPLSFGSLNVARGESHCMVKDMVQHQTSGSSTTTSVVEDGDGEIHSSTRESERESCHESSSVHHKYSKINANPNREHLGRGRSSTSSKKSAIARHDETYNEVRIDGDLKRRREQRYASSCKKQRMLLGF